MPAINRRKPIQLATLAVGAAVLPASSRFARGQASPPAKASTRVITLGRKAVRSRKPTGLNRRISSVLSG
jgi:hypothetical protein